MVEAMLKCVSKWSTDIFRDSFPGTDHSYSFDYSSSTDEITETTGRYEEFPDSSESPIHSISGSCSEGSDWANFDDINNILPVTDGSVSMLLDEGIVDSINVGDLNWDDLESFTNQTASSGTSENTGVSHVTQTRKKRKTSHDYLSSSTHWSSMSSEEQLETVQALTQIISQNMTLREQIEIISVIDPSAVISPNDTEFAIDMGSMNDCKLQTIKNIVKKHAIASSASSSSSSSNNFSGLPTSSPLAMCNISQTPYCHTPKVITSEEQVYEKRPYFEEIELRQRKLVRQNRREKRSGLFLYEKKITRLSSNPEEEDVDVNILD